MRIGELVQDVVQDVRYGLCMLRRSLGLTTVAILTLALGIGANTAIFSVLDALLLKTLPVHHPEQLRQLLCLSCFNTERTHIGAT